ncbi:MAG: CNP1-like family protein, partial [Gammaproteobacteria bacterium]
SYEGIRCDEISYKTYGRLDRNGKFRAVDLDWKPLNTSPSRIHRMHLATELFCDAYRTAVSIADIQSRLDGKRGQMIHLDVDEIRDDPY